MPPKARKVKDAAAIKIKEQAEAELLPLTYDTVAAVKFQPWKTSSKLTTSGKLGQVEAQWNVPANKFTQTIEVQHNEPFALKPLIVSEGRYKGQRVLVLSPVQNTDYFPFLELPPELRTMIYDLLLGGESTISIVSHKPPHRPRHPVTQGFTNPQQHRRDDLKWDGSAGKWIGQSPSDLSILRTNKQTRDEAAAAIYGRHFDLNTSTDADLFVEAIGSFRIFLKHISISSDRRVYSTRLRAMFKHLIEADNLRTITVSHEMICAEDQEFRRKAYTPSPGFYKACVPYVKKMHKARTASGAAVQALDLFQLTPVRTCVYCQDGGGKDCKGLYCTRDNKWEATMKCNESEAHDEDIRVKFRAALASLAGIKDE